MNRAKAFDWNGDIGVGAITRYVTHSNLAAGVQVCFNNADRRFDSMRTNSDSAHIGQRDNHAHRATAAHPEISGIVEEDHAGYASGIKRFTQKRADHSVGATRFVDNTRTK